MLWPYYVHTCIAILWKILPFQISVLETNKSLRSQEAYTHMYICIYNRPHKQIYMYTYIGIVRTFIYVHVLYIFSHRKRCENWV